MCGARLSRGFWLEGISGIAKCLWRETASGTAARFAIAEANLHSGNKERGRPRSQYRLEGMLSNPWQQDRDSRQGSQSPNLRGGQRSCRATWNHCCRHKIRIRNCGRRTDFDRRVFDPGFVSLLARRPIWRWPKPAEFRQTICARLSRDSRLEQDAAGAFVAERCDRENFGQIHRSVRAVDRRKASVAALYERRILGPTAIDRRYSKSLTSDFSSFNSATDLSILSRLNSLIGTFSTISHLPLRTRTGNDEINPSSTS